MSPAATTSWIDLLVQQHLDAAYNLGRWLLGNDADASDAVHDAYLRAVRSAHTYAGGNARAWWLAIVRNCCLAKLAARKREVPLREGFDGGNVTPFARSDNEAEERVHAAQQSAHIAEQLRALPTEFRETLVLREIEDLSYREIADVLGVPIGTVMSRLARGRALLQRALAPSAGEHKYGM